MTILLDTHALIWWVASPRELSARASRAIRTAAAQHALIASAISVFEITTACRRGRLQFTVPVDTWLDALQSLPELRIEPVTDRIARMAGTFDDAAPGDPADRIIAATAMTCRARLVSADQRLRKWKQVRTVW